MPTGKVESTTVMHLGPWVIGKSALRKYLRAVQNQSGLYEELDIVPPTAVAAHVYREFLRSAEVSAGTIQFFQKLESLRPVKAEEELHCQLKISVGADRGGWSTVSTDFMVLDQGGSGVVTGKTVVLIPSKEASP